MATLNWNVIDERTFRGRTRNVFEQVANTLTNTLGPYGSTTIIEKFGEMHITKDGWQILKKIAFDDTIEQNILQLLVNISAQVVIKVGDGSTSSIVSANSILKQLESSDHLKTVRPKELINVLNRVVEAVTNEILEASTKFDIETKDGLEEIYRLAMISTNGDEEVSRIIQTIYSETQNPSIEFDKSKSAKTTYDIIEGYKALITYLDGIYANNDEGVCNIDKPLILMFDHKVDIENHYAAIIQPAIVRSIEENRRLVVIAPHYDNFLLNQIRQQTNIEYRAAQTTQVVYARATLTTNLFQEQYNDFAIMTGGMVVREADAMEFHHEDATKRPVLNDYIGEVEKIAIGPDTTLIKGFFHRNEAMYELAVRDATSKYRKLEQTHRELNIVDSQLYEVKKRLSKLKGIMGVIHVGGQSSLEKVSNYDLVEDAVKATESAFNYGYNIGGNLIIPISISKLLAEKYSEPSDERVVLSLLWTAFRDVFTKVLGNKFTEATKEELDAIANKAIYQEQCYDLISDTYSTEVINPCHTDIEILRAATSIVSLLLSSNQYISIKINKDDNVELSYN
jgi:chaperonin GroEL